jgi:hypothetical protein
LTITTGKKDVRVIVSDVSVIGSDVKAIVSDAALIVSDVTVMMNADIQGSHWDVSLTAEIAEERGGCRGLCASAVEKSGQRQHPLPHRPE